MGFQSSGIELSSIFMLQDLPVQLKKDPDSLHFPAGTLADLKRTRSQNRVAGSTSSSLNTSNNSLTSQNELEGVTMNPGSHGPSSTSTSSPSSRRDPGVTLDPRAVSSRDPRSRPQSHHPNTSPNSRKKFAASSIEVVGPPLKTGCCSII